MYARRDLCLSLALTAGFLLAVGCGSSDDDSRDAGADLPRVTNHDASSSVADAAPLGRDAVATPDASTPGTDVLGGIDGAFGYDTIGVDGAGLPMDGGAKGLDGAVGEVGGSEAGTPRADGATSLGDAPLSPVDASMDATSDGFVPEPAVPIVVNSGGTGSYSLNNGTWKLFYFDATAGQLYCVGGLSDVIRGYVSTSPAVSPSNYDFVTDTASGALAFTAASAARYYVAIAAKGGSGSGWFQVADGGRLLSLGANSVVLDAPDMDNTYFFRFPVTKGHGYSITVTGASTNAVSLSVSPLAERATNGQFHSPAWSISGPLPISNQAVLASSVEQSYSGFYYLYLHVYAALTVSITIVQTS